MKVKRAVPVLLAFTASLLVFGGTASATTITSPTNTTYTGFFSATSWNSKIHGSFVTVECDSSFIHGNFEYHGGIAVGGSVSKLDFSGCNYAVNVRHEGSFSIDSSNAMRSNGMELELKTSIGTCMFGTLGTQIGTLTEGGWPDIHMNSAKIPRTGPGFLCGSSMTWTGGYGVSTPNPLWVD